jgi:phosphatidylinositol-3-phosphatase
VVAGYLRDSTQASRLRKVAPKVRKLHLYLLFLFGFLSTAAVLPLPAQSPQPAWPSKLPVYDHVLIVIEENKDYDEIIGSVNAPYINDVLRKEGAVFTRFYGEEHHSQGNYFFLFSGSDQSVGYDDVVPTAAIGASNLGGELVRTGRSFKGYSEDLPDLGRTVDRAGLYARKHVPWISFANLKNGKTADSSNLRFPQEFPANFSSLPTVCFVIPNLVNDMHDGLVSSAVRAGDRWLKSHLDVYYQWAKEHNSLLILTFDEDDNRFARGGLTDPAARGDRNRTVTIFAGAHIQAGEYPEDHGITHVNVLRTLEAMYGLKRSGQQSAKAAAAGIPDDFVIRDVFTAAGSPLH